MNRYVLFCSISIVFLTSLKAHSQTQADFDSVTTEMYNHSNNPEYVRKYAQQLEKFLKSNSELQTYTNYYVLINIYTNIAPDHRKKEEYNLVIEKLTYGGVTAEEFTKISEEISRTGDIGYLRKILKLKNQGNLNTITNSLLAMNFERLGDFKTAEDLYQKDLVKMDLENQYDVAQLYLPIQFFIKTGKFSEAEMYIDIMNDVAETADSIMVTTIKNISTLAQQEYYRSIGNYYGYMRAAEERQELLNAMMERVQQEQPCPTDDLSLLVTRAHALEMLRQFDEAEELWKQYDKQQESFRKCYEKNYGPYKWEILDSSPQFKVKRYGLSSINNLVELREKADKMFATAGTEGVQHQRNRGAVYAHLGDERYHNYYDQAIEHTTSLMDFSMATTPIAEYAYFQMRDRRFKDADRTYDNLFKENIDWINDLLFTFGERSFISYFNNYLRAGYNNYHSFVKVGQEVKFSRFNHLKGQAYDNLLLTKSIAFRSGQKKKKAFIKSEDSTTVALFDLWIQAKNRLINLHQMQQQQALQQQMKSQITRDQLIEAQREVNKIENELAQRSVAFRELVEVNEPTWEDVKNKLAPREAAIEMIRFNWRDQVYYSDTAYYAAYIVKWNSKAPEVVYLPALADVLEGPYFKNYQNSIRFNLEDTISHRQYWEPIQQQLGDIEKVYFSPDGVYHLISLPTLRNQESQKYILEEIEIEIVATTADPGNAIEDILEDAVLIGRPAYEDKIQTAGKGMASTRSAAMNLSKATLRDLPGTEDEVLAVADLLRENNTRSKVYLGTHATEDELYRLNAPDILHIATHGYWAKIDYEATAEFRSFFSLMNSGLLLAGVADFYKQEVFPDRNDGLLTAFEAQNLNLEGTQMVVLSACETGIGDVQAGEGVYGLSRSIRLAGAETVLISLWKIDDVATKDFMIAFYQNYVGTGNKQQAFIEAQRTMMKKYSDPFFWGAFVLVR